jgi:DUF1680 family protein
MIEYEVKPKLSPLNASFDFNGCIDAYIKAVTTNWLLIAPDANRGMLEMFRDRDRLPFRNMVPWAGEFAGKYLTAATQVSRVTHDIELQQYLSYFVTELLSLQGEDGYLGPWPTGYHFINSVDYPDGSHIDTWDTWGHYHIMIGLLFYYESTNNKVVLDCACRIADGICLLYFDKLPPKLVETGDTEMNLAPAHSFCFLYRHTGNEQYLKMAIQLVDEEFGMKDEYGNFLAGDWLNGSLAGKDFYQLPKPRWESLHPIMAIAELYWLTGDDKYRKAFIQIWQSIVRLDRHNNGGFSSGEQAQGNPYHPGAIETCCTIAWTALTVEMLKLTGDSRVADELELTLYNSVLGMHNYTGRWATYDTPMDGVRIASAHAIVFQSREGTPELNCCSVNSARGFGMISDWAIMLDDEGIRLNLYEPGDMSVKLSQGNKVQLVIDTEYPSNNNITIKVNPTVNEECCLSLRIPRWSTNTEVYINGQLIKDIVAGTYLALNRKWENGDVIEIIFDFSLHCWVGEKECEGKISLYRGPILLTFDRRFNEINFLEIPLLDVNRLSGELIEWQGRIPPIILMKFSMENDQNLYLCDFGSAGEGGTPYKSWLPIGKNTVSLPQYFSTWSNDNV